MKKTSLCVFSAVMFLTGCASNLQIQAPSKKEKDESVESSADQTVTVKEEVSNKKTVNSDQIDKQKNKTDAVMAADATITLDNLKDTAIEKVDSVANELNVALDNLYEKTNTLEKYESNIDLIEEYFESVEKTVNELNYMLGQYSIDFANIVLDSDMSFKDKYDLLDDIEDYIYEDARDEAEDEIYDDLFDKMNDYYYEGFLEEALDDDANDYSDIYDIRSDFYSDWYDCRKEVYSQLYDFGSDLYSFIYDTQSKLYREKLDKAKEEVADYQKKLEKSMK